MLQRVNKRSPDTLIQNPQTRILSGATELPAAARKAWAMVGDFAGFHQFITGLEKIEMTGSGVRSVRKKFFGDGNLVLEQLNSHDDEQMVMTWTLLYTSLNIDNLWACMSVEELDAQRCRVVWDIAGTPKSGTQEEFEAFIEGFLQMAMGNLQKIFAA